MGIVSFYFRAGLGPAANFQISADDLGAFPKPCKPPCPRGCRAQQAALQCLCRRPEPYPYPHRCRTLSASPCDGLPVLQVRAHRCFSAARTENDNDIVQRLTRTQQWPGICVSLPSIRLVSPFAVPIQSVTSRSASSLIISPGSCGSTGGRGTALAPPKRTKPNSVPRQGAPSRVSAIAWMPP